jgi:hypothetical protein
MTTTNNGDIIFLDAPGGTGKTYLINLILAKVRLSQKIALAVASSGIAATLLHGGRTAHSTFKLPLNLHATDSPTCNISSRSGLAKLLQKTTLIVWDECTMAHKGAFEALDRTLQDLRQNSSPMGGITLLLAGDFRQTLPVFIPMETYQKNYSPHKHASTPHTSRQRHHHHLYHHTIHNFTPTNRRWQTIPRPFGQPHHRTRTTQEELLQHVFPDITANYKRQNWLSVRAILAPRNDIVRELNHTLLQSLPGQTITYKSIDTVPDIDNIVNYPVEFLNSVIPSGMPPHKLELKEGTPIMLLRNLDAPKLCNGTRLIVKTLHTNLIEANIAIGQYSGQMVLIPLIPSDCPFHFKRLQFPVQPSFAMSINKSQGQTLKVAGLFLTVPGFSHGQLYVATSRVGNPANLFYLAQGHRTVNVVYNSDYNKNTR